MRSNNNQSQNLPTMQNYFVGGSGEQEEDSAQLFFGGGSYGGQ